MKKASNDNNINKNFFKRKFKKFFLLKRLFIYKIKKKEINIIVLIVVIYFCILFWTFLIYLFIELLKFIFN